MEPDISKGDPYPQCKLPEEIDKGGPFTFNQQLHQSTQNLNTERKII